MLQVVESGYDLLVGADGANSAVRAAMVVGGVGRGAPGVMEPWSSNRLRRQQARQVMFGVGKG